MNKKKVNVDVKNIAVDYNTWKILKQVALDTDTNIKIILKRLIEEHLTV